MYEKKNYKIITRVMAVYQKRRLGYENQCKKSIKRQGC